MPLSNPSNLNSSGGGASSTLSTEHRPIRLVYDIPPGPSQFFLASHAHKPGSYMDTSGQVVNSPPHVDAINAANSLDLSDGTEVHYRGSEKVSQVLRWISSTVVATNKLYVDGLLASKGQSKKRMKTDPDNQKKTPEIQSAVVGEKVLIGSNSTDDGEMANNLRQFLQDATANGVLSQGTSTTLTGEKLRQKEQQQRHAKQLFDFVNNDQFAAKFISTAKSELGKNLIQAQLVERLLTNIRVALQTGNELEMAPSDPNKPLIHAEQRIIEYIQNAQDQLYKKYLNSYPPEFHQQDVPLLVFLGGTKPPCAYCDTVERARHAQARQSAGGATGSSSRILFRIWRNEDPTQLEHQHSVGKYFSSPFCAVDDKIGLWIDHKVFSQGRPTDFFSFTDGGDAVDPSGVVSDPNTERLIRLPSHQPVLTPSPQPQTPLQNQQNPLFKKQSGALGGPVFPEAPWKPVDLQKFGEEIREKLKTPDTHQATEESRWIGQLQGDDVTSNAVNALFLKHPRDSQLIRLHPNEAADGINTSLRWDSQSQSVVLGTLSAEHARLKLMLVGHGVDSYKIDPKMIEIRAHTVGKRVIVLSGFSELDYADSAALEAQIKNIFEQQARHVGGYDKLIVVAGATNPGIGRAYKLADALGIKTLGIVSQEGSELVSPYCKQVVLINDPDKTWKVLAPSGASYMVSAAAEGGVFYALGGGEITYSELEEAKKRQIDTYTYSFAPDPDALARRQEADKARGKIVQSYTPVNDSIEGNNGSFSSGRGERIVFGGRSIETLKNDFRRMLEKIPPRNVRQIDIDLVGCNLVDDPTLGSTLPRQLADILLAQSTRLHINPKNLTLSARQYYVRVRSDGKKEIYLPDQGWVTKEDAIAKNELYKSVWRYDSDQQKMVAEVQPDRLKVLVDKLFQGQLVFYELSTQEQQLISRVLSAAEIDSLSKRNPDGIALQQAVDILAKKSADVVEITLDTKTALYQVFDEEADAWEKVASDLKLTSNKNADIRAGAMVLQGMEQSGLAATPVDRYTQQALGLRARVMQKFQTYVGNTGRGVLALGAVAALCRIKMNNERLASGKLSEAEATKLRAENALALAELGADLSDEVIGLVQNKLNIQITKPAASAVSSVSLSPQASGLSLGRHITRGIRNFGPGAAGTLLSAVGTGFAWYGVHTAAHELRTLSLSEKAATDLVLKARIAEQITQLQVNLGVNIATAIISTGLTVGGAVTFAAGMAASLGLVGAASVAAVASVFMSVAGPIGGALLVGAFVGLWIYNGVKTVEEFSRHMALTGWNRFELGFGSMFGWVPDHLQRQYNFQKLKVLVEEAAQLEARKTFENMPEVKEIYALIFPEFPYGGNLERARNRHIDIDMDQNRYKAWSLNGTSQSFDPDKFIYKYHKYKRVTRDPIQTGENTYQHVTHLSLLPLSGSTSKVIHLLKSAWGRQVNATTQKGKFSSGKEEVMFLSLERNINGKNMLKMRAYSVASIKQGSIPSVLYSVDTELATDTRLHAALKISYEGRDWDELLVLLSDRILVQQGGVKNFRFVPFGSTAETAGLRAILNVQPQSKVFAVNESGRHLALFCIRADTGEISSFKYRIERYNDYKLVASLTQSSPVPVVGLQHDPLGSGIFFQDLNGDGLADLVVVNSDGSLQVACQQRDGNFVLTDAFSIYRAKTLTGNLENLSFAEHKILGFGGTARTLYSVDSHGAVYTHTIVSKEEKEAQVSWVNMNIPHGVDDFYGYMEVNPDKFIASSKPEAGEFIFRLGGGRDKRVTGGINNDRFILLDDKTSCTLDGRGGRDTLDFSQLKLRDQSINGLKINVLAGKASLKQAKDAQSIYSNLERISFSNIEDFIGSEDDDEITGDDKDNILDGFKGEDTIDGGAGNDVLRGVDGTFKGGLGTDRYELHRPSCDGALNTFIEDYSLKEDSHVALDYRMDEIKSIAPENGKHLLITFSALYSEIEPGPRSRHRYRLQDFYANQYAHSGVASAWHFTTRDGFRFRLETAAAPPTNTTTLSGISVSFQSTLTQEELGQKKIDLYAREGNTGARVEIFEKIADQEEVKREIALSPLFELELRHPGKQGVITGSSRSERLIGKSGIRLKGNAGADTYLIEDAARGIVEIDNHDVSSTPEQDSLVLPWELSQTILSVQGKDISLKHATQPDNHVEICVVGFMNHGASRHLTVRGLFDQTYHLGVIGTTVYLASGALVFTQEDRLEVLSASQGGLELDGRRRELSTGNARSTVIVDQSGKGNHLFGTENARNYLQVLGENNGLYGGRLADELHGGSGNDRMEGKEGNDVYYVKGSATIHDTGGEDTLVLLATDRRAQEELWLEKTDEGDLLIRFRHNKRTVTVQGYDKPAQKIEHIVMGDARLSYGDIDYLISAMSTMTAFADHVATSINPSFTEAMSRWSTVIAAPGG
ncbi:MAG: hypothetical protein IT497_05110 [Ottowia sp.]|nr:hypothetical protein [Ottowia sp.]